MKVFQKDVVNISLNPTRGKEQRGVRPAIVISGNAFHVSGLCVVCPLTTKIHNFAGDINLKPSAVNGLKSDSEVLLGHIRSVSIERIHPKKLGVIQSQQLKDIFSGIDLVLDR